jgi:hypothetical protein
VKHVITSFCDVCRLERTGGQFLAVGSLFRRGELQAARAHPSPVMTLASREILIGWIVHALGVRSLFLPERYLISQP